MEIWDYETKISRTKLIKIIIAGVITGIVLPIFVILFLFLLFLPELPPVESLENYSPPLTTIVYSCDGEVLAEFSGERRIWVPLSQVPQVLKDALISAEDKSFWKHWGLDSWGIFRALVVNLTRGSIRQGGSSITQQLARALFLGTERTLVRKIKEALTAIKLEQKYSKDEILELYLNQNYMGRGNYGVEAAAKYYFGKHINEIDVAEAATLVGLLKAPEIYTPVKYPERAKRRRNLVLEAMCANGKLDKHTADSLKQAPIVLAQEREGYFKAPYFSEFVRQYIESKYGEDMLYRSGAKVYTTLDWRLQRAADSIMARELSMRQRWIQKIHHITDTSYTQLVFDSTKGDTVRVWKKLQGALLAIETKTGAIKALVGGTNFWESQFNRAVQAQRQPGSAFKPFVYTAAIDNGYKPCDLIDDLPITERLPNGELWRPSNYDDQYLGPITLRKALYRSRNLATVRLAKLITINEIIKYAHRMGIRSSLQPNLSLALGSCEVTLIDLVTAYSIFPNNGVKVKPYWIERIEDKNGVVIEENKPQKEEVLSPTTAYIMLDMLRDVIRHGTGIGARLRGFDWDAGGKTGTTNDFTDAWFIGFSPRLVTGVWVGFDDKTRIGDDMNGARVALPIWTDFMIFAHRKLRREEFPIPKGIVYADICSESHLLATKRCPEVIREIFTEQNKPEAYCPLSHRPKEEHIPLAGSDEPTEKPSAPKLHQPTIEDKKGAKEKREPVEF